MANDQQNTDWQPVQNVYQSPTQSSDKKETIPPISSPPSHGAPYLGHSNQAYVTDASYLSSDSNYQSQTSQWDPYQQNVPIYNQKGDSFIALIDPNAPDGRKPNQQRKPPGRTPGCWIALSDFYTKTWTPKWTMVFFFLCGIAFALGHHFYYESLDGTSPDEQLRKLRYGTALAFLSKICLVTSVIAAYRQYVWMIVRHKILALGTVDALFAAAEDITAMFHWDAFRRAKIAMLLAVYIWATPIVVILASQTISVQPKRVQQNTTCPGVMTLNFTHEATVSWRDVAKTEDDFYQLLLSYWNATVTQDDYNISDPNSFDYWTDTSTQFETLAVKNRYLSSVLPRENASEIVCGKGWNCSVTINFVGPGYKCEEVASGVNDTVKSIRGAESPFDTTQLAPVGDYVYFARTDQGEYGSQQLEDVDGGGIPKIDPPYPKNLGALRTEPLLWVGYSMPRNSSNIPQNKKTNWTDDAFIPKIIGCEHYMTNYSVALTYANEAQSRKVLQRTNISRIVDTRYLPDTNIGNDGLFDNITATPQSNYIFPTDVYKYREAFAYHSIGKQLREALNGSITLLNKVASTEVFVTRLIEKRNYLAVDNLAEEIETFYEDLVLSLLSDPQYAVVSWAQNPAIRAGQQMEWGQNYSQYACVKQQISNRYLYHRRDLWLVYGVAILFALVAVIVGFYATRYLHRYDDTRFSTFVSVTRAHSLNAVSWEKDDDHLKNTRIGFGRVFNVAGETKRGFGLEGEVTQDREGEPVRTPVIRLKEWRERKGSKIMENGAGHP